MNIPVKKWPPAVMIQRAKLIAQSSEGHQKMLAHKEQFKQGIKPLTKREKG